MELPMLLAYVVLILITIHLLYIVLNSKQREVSCTSLPLPPGPVKLPVVGSALFFIGSRFHSLHRDLAHLTETYGPIVSFRPGMASNFVVVSSSAAAREALAENDAALAARWVPDTTRALGYNAGSLLLLPSSNPLWKQHRITLSAQLSSGRGLDVTRPIRERQARQLAEYFRACSGQPVTVGAAVLNVVLNAMSNILFSKDVVELRVQGGQVFKDLIEAVNKESIKPNISDAFPFLAPLDLFGYRRSVTRSLAKLFKFVDNEFIESRLASGENQGDLLDVVLARHAKSQLTRSEITKFCIEIFVTASETSTATVHWALAQLLCHPDKMKKVSAELVENLGTKDFAEESDLNKLPYIRAVVKETLRLHPSVPLIPREVVADGVSLGGFAIPIGTRILVNLWAIGRDPVAWPEPEKFMPERFMDDQTVNFRGLNFAYRPFGAGRKMCPGIELATRFVPLLLASILHKVNWTLPIGMEPKDIDLTDHHGTVLDLATPLCAVPLYTM